MLDLCNEAFKMAADQQVGPGLMLEGLKLVRLGDWDEVPKLKHPALCIEGPEQLEWSAGGSCIKFEWQIEFLLYTLNAKSNRAAIKENLDLYWRETDDGPRGVLPWLAAISRGGIAVNDIQLALQVVTKPERGVIKLNDGSWQALSCTSLRVQTMRQKVSLP